MHKGKIGSRKWYEDVQKDLISQIESIEHLYQNIDSLYESWVMRVSTALMVNKATSRKNAIDPGKLPVSYRDTINDVILKGYVKSVTGRVYLTTRGKLIANCGMKELVDNGMWPPTVER